MRWCSGRLGFTQIPVVTLRDNSRFARLDKFVRRLKSGSNRGIDHFSQMRSDGLLHDLQRGPCDLPCGDHRVDIDVTYIELVICILAARISGVWLGVGRSGRIMSPSTPECGRWNLYAFIGTLTNMGVTLLWYGDHHVDPAEQGQYLVTRFCIRQCRLLQRGIQTGTKCKPNGCIDTRVLRVDLFNQHPHIASHQPRRVDVPNLLAQVCKTHSQLVKALCIKRGKCRRTQ